MSSIRTLDFFKRQRSQALHTRFRMLSWASIELDRCEDMIMSDGHREYMVA
jgi:hypothetical protein